VFFDLSYGGANREQVSRGIYGAICRDRTAKSTKENTQFLSWIGPGFHRIEVACRQKNARADGNLFIFGVGGCYPLDHTVNAAIVIPRERCGGRQPHPLLRSGVIRREGQVPETKLDLA